MEALKVKLQNKKYGGNIEYRTYCPERLAGLEKEWTDGRNDRGKTGDGSRKVEVDGGTCGAL